MSILFVCCVLSILCANSDSANILVLEGVPSPSHHIWIRTIMTALVQNGHNITSLSADVDTIPIPNLHYLHMDRVYPELYNQSEQVNFVELGRINPWLKVIIYTYYTKLSCLGYMKSRGIQQLLAYPQNFKYDLVLYDYIYQSCLPAVLHKFNYPPMISVTAFNAVQSAVSIIGSQYYSYIPHCYRNEFQPTFLGRVENFLLFHFDYYIREWFVYAQYDRIIQKYVPGARPLIEIEKTSRLVLINSHPAVDITEPLLPNVIPVGGLQIHAPKYLPPELRKIADSAKNGLILFSLGTNMRSDMLGTSRLLQILEGFRRIPDYTVLWKFESNDLPVDIPSNVHIKAWLPQNEILAHPNTILFITHCGMLSFQEAVWFGVPMLGIPIFADQFLNNKRAVDAGISRFLDIQKLSHEYLRKEILAVVQNKTFVQNIKKLSMSFRDQPELPLNRAIWWIERVLRNPDLDYLQSSGKHYSLISRQSIDVIAFIVAALLLTMYIGIKIFCNCYKWISVIKRSCTIAKDIKLKSI